MGGNTSVVTNIQAITVIGNANTIIASTKNASGDYMEPIAVADTSDGPDAWQNNINAITVALKQLADGKYWTDFNYIWTSDPIPPRSLSGFKPFGFNDSGAFSHPVDNAKLSQAVQDAIKKFDIGDQEGRDLNTDMTNHMMTIINAKEHGVNSFSVTMHYPYTGIRPHTPDTLAQFDVDLVYFTAPTVDGVETYFQILATQYWREAM